MNKTQANQLAKSGRFSELWQRLGFLVMGLIVYRIGVHIPVPGISLDRLRQALESAQSSIVGLFNLFSGGALQNSSVLTLGIMPYISASIIMQLLSYTVPSLEALKKEGASGQRTITKYTRYLTVVLVLFQALGVAIATEKGGLALNPGPAFRITTVVSLTAGSMFLMWLGEQITERGLGNGISMIIFSGIAAGIPVASAGFLEQVRNGAIGLLPALFIIVLVGAVTYLVVFVERGQRKVLLTYARRQIGTKMYAGQSSHLPLKLNMSGVIPPIFASSIVLLPATMLQFSSSSESMLWLRDFSTNLQPGHPIYVTLYAALIIFFAFFYTSLVFNSKETADNLKRSGAFIPGIRPGEQTARYIDKVIVRLTLSGAIYVTLVCLLPEFLTVKYGVSFHFGGTSLLIAVVVAMDFMAQVQAHVMSQQYESLLRKANFKTPGMVTR